MILLRADSINVLPLNNAYGSVVLGMDTSNVDTVFVAGQLDVVHDDEVVEHPHQFGGLVAIGDDQQGRPHASSPRNRRNGNVGVMAPP